MAVNATSSAPASQAPPGPPPIKRRFRNYLLDPRFQLKYTSYVVVVTIVVASVLGYFAYQESHAQTEMMMINRVMAGEAADFIEQEAESYDRNLLLAIIGGIAVLGLALGVTGVLVTHRVVGPAYKMKLLFQHVRDGHLTLKGRLRKGDELQDVFLVFEEMIEALRGRQREEIVLLESALQRARESGASEESLRDLETLKTRMEKALE
jgi:nitrogen fixation/metabolism regulation signal transduction histidine kinase